MHTSSESYYENLSRRYPRGRRDGVKNYLNAWRVHNHKMCIYVCYDVWVYYSASAGYEREFACSVNETCILGIGTFKLIGTNVR